MTSEIDFDAHETEIVELLEALKTDIEDDFRASDDIDDDIPGMQVTLATDDDCIQWTYQTGDNSFTGNAYGWPHWAVISLYRDSNTKELAKEVADEWATLICQ